jgi:Methyltransferase domain/Domain of unknown function (DUF4214)
MTSLRAVEGRYDEIFLTELYRIFFNREPDPAGFEDNLSQIRAGLPLHKVVETFLKSDEFSHRGAIPTPELPDLRALYPDRYERDCYLAVTDDRISQMEQLITTGGYYDHFGIWSSAIDNDKVTIAKLVLALGAKSCLEVGCFNGPVLSVLHEHGLEVTGIDLSHLAFVMAFPNIRDRLLYGNLLSVPLNRKYDCILLLDVLEHLNPLQLGHHICRLRELLAPRGIIILNSPMFGIDDIFGTVFEQSLQEWRDIGDRDFYRHWPCDTKGWPMHGHMVWASPKWWTAQFGSYHIVRLREIEQTVQERLSGYFSWAPARRSMFFLNHQNAAVDTAAISMAIGRCEWA